jgi:hypothetical protein
MIQDPRVGMYFFDDFTVIGSADMSSAYKGSNGQWASYGYAGAQMNDAQKEGSVIKLSSDGDNEGLTLLSQGGAFRFVTTSTLAYNGKMWFEVRLAKSSVASAHLNFFAGLMAPTLSSGLPAAAQPITTTDDTVMTAGDLFGFFGVGTTSTRGGPTEVEVDFVLASGTINRPYTTLMADSGNTVLAADSYVKLGWVFDPAAYTQQVTNATARQTAGNLRAPVLQFYVNGNKTSGFLTYEDVKNSTAGQAFPTSFMCPVLSVMNMASQSSDYLAVDWIRVAQIANS